MMVILEKSRQTLERLTKKIWSLVLSGKRLIQKAWTSLVSSMKSVLSRLKELVASRTR